MSIPPFQPGQPKISKLKLESIQYNARKAVEGLMELYDIECDGRCITGEGIQGIQVQVKLGTAAGILKGVYESAQWELDHYDDPISPDFLNQYKTAVKDSSLKSIDEFMKDLHLPYRSQ